MTQRRVGLQRWAQEAVDQNPQRKPMWLGMEQPCRALDLQGLKRLAAAASN